MTNSRIQAADVDVIETRELKVVYLWFMQVRLFMDCTREGVRLYHDNPM